MSNKGFNKKAILISIIIIVLFGVIFYFVKNNSKEEQKIMYTEMLLTKSNINIFIESTGSVQPENKLEIKPPISGRVEKILVNEGDKVNKAQIIAWMSSTERAALIDAALSKGKEEYQKWSNLYKATPIMAPIQGTIIQKNIETGQVFTNNDAVFVMSNRLTVKALVDETDIAQIKKGQTAFIVLDAYSDKQINAVVSKIAFDAQTINNVTTYEVDVTPLKTPSFMRSGMTSSVTFSVKEKKDIIKIPNNALKTFENNFYVLLKNEKSSLIKQYVKIGTNDGQYTEITEGLNEGDIILLETTDAKMKKLQQNKNTNPFMPVRPGSSTRNKKG